MRNFSCSEFWAAIGHFFLAFPIHSRSLPPAAASLFALAATVSLNGCHAGGNITASIASVAPSPITASPTIATPGLSPYYSNAASITISGVCNTGSTVSISGDAISSTPCSNNSYSFTVSKTADSVYSFFLTQSSAAGSSSPTLFAWIKKTSVASPLILAPALNPYYSGESILTISGQCENNSTISLSGDGSGSTVCAGSIFALTLPKAIDGTYNLTVTQTDLAGNTASVPLVWNKHALTVTPDGVSVPAGSTQPLTMTGGSNSYHVTLTDNQSGGTYAAGVYTVGPKAGVVDTITVTDDANSTKVIHLTTTAGGPDHLVFATISGDGQSGVAGQLLTIPLKGQLVDQFGNGLANYALVFRVTLGDASFVGSPIQTTDSQGFVTVNVRAGFGSPFYAIQLKPVSTLLPDVNSTGNTTLTFAESALTAGTGRFGTLFDVGSNPDSVAAADFDGDGKVDVAVLHGGERSIGILKGRGDGTYSAVSKFSTTCIGTQIVTADFNGDGKQDLATTCSGERLLNIYLGAGDGSFALAASIDTGGNETYPSGLVAADFNGDGKVDLALSSATGRVVAVRFGNGNGTFAAPAEYAIDTPASTRTAGPLAAGKIKHGTLPDLAATLSGSAGGVVSVLINDGTGHFAGYVQHFTGTNPSAIAIGDLNGDGYAEMVVTNAADNNATVLLNSGDGTFDDTNSTQLDVTNGAIAGQTPVGVTIADFNGDNRNDIAIVNNDSSSLSIFTKNTSGGYDLATFATGSSPVFVTAKDVNSDTVPDILIANSGSDQVQIIPVQSGGVVDFKTALGNNPVALRTADFNGDGNYDVAVINQNDKTVSVLLGNGKGFFTLASTLTTANNPVDLVTGDFDQDGKLDLAVLSGSGSVRIFHGVGNGTFGTGTDVTTGLQPVALIARDFNGDGLLDLAVVSQTSQAVGILLNQLDTTVTPNVYSFRTLVNYGVGSGPVALASADFNGDHNPDIVVVNNSGNGVSVLISNGDGTFQTQRSYSTGSSPVSIAIGDFNGDGQPDLAVVGSAASTVDVLFGVGDGSFGTFNSYSCGNTPGAIVAGDFNGDGKVDLAVSNQSGYGFTILNGQSNGQFNVSTFHATGGAVGAMRVTDVNGDGKLDLALLNPNGNFIQMWMGH